MRLFLIVHLIIVIAIIILVALVKGDKIEGIIAGIISLVFPIGGYLISLFMCIDKKESTKEIKYYDDDLKDKEFIRQINLRDKEEVISLEDSLILNSKRIKRKQVLSKLKESTLNHLDTLRLALEDEDIETSHYASVALIEAKNRFEQEIQRLAVDFEKDRDNLESIYAYKESISNYLNSGLIEQYNENLYKETYIELLEKIMNKNPEKNIYIEIINVYLENGNLSKAGELCYKFFDECKCEESYVLLLKYYYNLKSIEEFKKVFNSLIVSSIDLSREGLELVRFWMEVVK